MAFSQGFAYLHTFLDTISTLSLHHSLGQKCGRLWEKQLLPSLPLWGWQLFIVQHQIIICTDEDFILCDSNHILLCHFFCYSDSLIVEYSVYSPAFRSSFHLWKFPVCGVMIFLLDVCHVDKSVAGMECMNNPWSKDVYSASWSWEAIIQLQLFCHTPADCLEIP